MYKVEGFFRVVVRERDVVVADSGYIKNAVTKMGLDALFTQLDGNDTATEYTTERWTGLALGTGQATPNFDYYNPERTTLLTELTDTAYARKSLTGTGYTKTQSLHANRTGQSYVRWGQFWDAAFVDETRTINEIGIYDSATKGTEFLLAGTSFAGISVTTAQRVDATYTLTVVQA